MLQFVDGIFDNLTRRRCRRWGLSATLLSSLAALLTAWLSSLATLATLTTWASALRWCFVALVWLAVVLVFRRFWALR